MVSEILLTTAIKTRVHCYLDERSVHKLSVGGLCLLGDEDFVEEVERLLGVGLRREDVRRPGQLRLQPAASHRRRDVDLLRLCAVKNTKELHGEVHNFCVPTRYEWEAHIAT